MRKLHELEIPDGIASVGGDAFSDCVSVTVRSTISGKPLYKAVTATDGSSAYNFILRNIWGKDGFDFTAQDNYFPALQDENLQYAIAFSRLMYRVNLSAQQRSITLIFCIIMRTPCVTVLRWTVPSYSEYAGKTA